MKSTHIVQNTVQYLMNLAATIADNRYTALLAALFLIGTYLDVTFRTALHNGLWADEVLCVSASQLPRFSDVFDAIWKGSEYSPPTYDLLMHYFLQITRSIPPLLADRLPSIVAVFGAAVAVYLLVRPKMTLPSALLSAGLVLSMIPYLYAIQARPYALILFCCSMSLLQWDRMDAAGHTWRRATLLWLFMSLCVLLHFYGFFYVVTIGLCEGLYFLTRRTFRPAVLVALLGTVPVMLSLYPLATHMSVFLNADIPSQMKFHDFPGYILYAAATKMMLGINGYWLLLAGYSISPAFILFALRRFAMGGKAKILWPTHSEHTHNPDNIGIVMLALLLTLAFAFGFTYFVTQSFAPRYVLGTALFPAFLIGYLFNKLHDGKLIALLVLILVLPHHLRSMGATKGDDTKIASRQSYLPYLEMIGQKTNLPIVIDSPDFIALKWGASANLQPHLAYLMTPNIGPQPNLPSDFQLERLTHIFPDMPVYPFESFVVEHQKFYIVSFSADEPTGSIEESLHKRNMLGPKFVGIDNLYISCAGTEGVKTGCN